jgi:spermidine synthase
VAHKTLRISKTFGIETRMTNRALREFEQLDADHAITREAFRTYFRHLKPSGILAVNISNTYLNLEPVMERAANAFGKVGIAYHWVPPDDDSLCFSCSWTLIMDPATFEAHPELQSDAKILRPERPFRIPFASLQS